MSRLSIHLSVSQPLTQLESLLLNIVNFSLFYCAMSEDLKTLLDSQKEAILSSVNERISGLQETILKQQEDLACKFEAEEGSYQFKKKGNEQQNQLQSVEKPTLKPSVQ